MIDRQLIERIEQELQEIREIITQTEQFIEQGQSTDASLYQEALSSAIALNLHSFYTGVERIFEAIARRIDYWEPASEQWHRQWQGTDEP
ncbi:hypothetical protein [Aphanothece hegewaldii]|uniref:ribonuclease toxin HepT-like protein n=1 Tax=Aphanothece hegewaldii TaxID=1521625 RepID=UPI001FEACDDC|nr:hypothetical protein [Aphanothece hegewaldii]